VVNDTRIQVVNPEETLAGAGIAADEDGRVVDDPTAENRVEAVDAGLYCLWHAEAYDRPLNETTGSGAPTGCSAYLYFSETSILVQSRPTTV